MKRPPHYFCDDDILFPALLLLVGPPPAKGLRLRPDIRPDWSPSSKIIATTQAARRYKKAIDVILWPMAQDIYESYKRGYRAKKSHQRRNEFIIWILGRKKD